MEENSRKQDNLKERVLMVHNFYQIGGGEHTVFENEQRLLREHGHHVVAYTRDNAELKKSVLKKILLPFTTIFSLKTGREVKRIIRREQIDIIHCHNTFPLVSPSVYYTAKKCGIPVIQTIHNFRFLCPNGVFFRDGQTCEDCMEQGLKCSLRHRCYRESWLQTFVLVTMLRIHRKIGTFMIPEYIFLTEFNRGKFFALLGKKAENGFIKPNFEYIKLPEAGAARDGSFVFIGRLDRNKGIDFLTRNWERDRELYVFGNGALENAVREACEKNCHIHYMGFQQQDVVFTYLAKAAAMLFPTDLYEGFPMTIIEAFALGTPVICSDIGNGADLVKQAKAGVAFTRRSRDGLEKAIAEVERNFDMYSANAREAYGHMCTPEANYRQLKTIYEAVAG